MHNVVGHDGLLPLSYYSISCPPLALFGFMLRKEGCIFKERQLQAVADSRWSEASGAEQNPPPCGRGAGTTVQGRNACAGRAAVVRIAIAIAVTHSISCPESSAPKGARAQVCLYHASNAWIPCLTCPPSTGITGRCVSPCGDETRKGFGGEVTPPRSGSCGQDPLTVVAPGAGRMRCFLYSAIFASARFPVKYVFFCDAASFPGFGARHPSPPWGRPEN